MLNEEQFKNKWHEIKGGIRNLWGRITEEELDEMKNDINEVSGLVEERYGESKAEIKVKLKQLMDSFDNESDKNFSIGESSYQRNPLHSRTSAESQISDEADDFNTRSPERYAFDNKTYGASDEGAKDPQHHSNYSGANPGRERFKPSTFDKTVE